MDFLDFKKQIIQPLANQLRERIDMEFSKKHPSGLRLFEKTEPIDDFVARSATQDYFGDIIKKVLQNRRVVSRTCQCPYEECKNKNGAKNHIFPQRKVLRNLLSDNGHVYALNANVNDQNRGQFDFHRVGINKTAHFCIFCSNCDGKLFRLIDNKLPLEDFNDRETFAKWLNLLQYRGFCAAFDFMIDRSVKFEMLVNLEEEHKKNGIPQFFNATMPEVTMKDFRNWFSYSYDFWEWKKDFDMYLRKMPKNIVHRAWLLDVETPSIAGSVVTVRDHQNLFVDAIHHKTWGSKIPLITPNRTRREKSFSVITAIPVKKTQTLCVFSYLNMHKDVIKQDENFEWTRKPRIMQEELKQKVSEHLLHGMSLFYGDQLILAPRFYESLPTEKQEALKGELNIIDSSKPININLFF